MREFRTLSLRKKYKRSVMTIGEKTEMSDERLDDFMGRANATYYGNCNPFSDFITSPEISQIFGEILGGWVAVVKQHLPRGPFMLAEAGPGRGTLMSDALRLLQRVPDIMAAMEVHLVETSPRLRQIQKEALAAFDIKPVWHDRIESLPVMPFVFLGNEFLDALPVRQFVRCSEVACGWKERWVRGENFVLHEASDLPAELLLREAEEGEIVEISPAMLHVAEWLGNRLKNGMGAALLIDYGPSRSAPGDSLQALHKGRPADPLMKPGEADLTVHVDFEAIGRKASSTGARCFGPVTQGNFLSELGASARLEQLCRAAPDQAAALRTGLDRLMAPDRMGHLFKVLALTSPDMMKPPGF